MRLSALVLPVAVLTLTAGSSVAQAPQDPALRIGDRLRVEYFDDAIAHRIEGVLLNDSGPLEIRTDVGVERVATRSVVHVERFERRSSRLRSFGRGIGYGLAAGALIGGIGGFLAGDDPENTFFAFTAEEKALLLGTMGGGVGILIGGIVGLAQPTHEWRALDRTALRASLIVPARGGVGIAIGVPLGAGASR